MDCLTETGFDKINNMPGKHIIKRMHTQLTDCFILFNIPDTLDAIQHGTHSSCSLSFIIIIRLEKRKLFFL